MSQCAVACEAEVAFFFKAWHKMHWTQLLPDFSKCQLGDGIVPVNNNTVATVYRPWKLLQASCVQGVNVVMKTIAFSPVLNIKSTMG